MPELSEDEKAAAEAELKKQTLAENERLTQGIAQLKTNIEEMEREGRVTVKTCPALDSKSTANAGKSQWEISKANLQSYVGARDTLVNQYSKYFEVGE